VISLNSGGNSEIVINSDKYIGGYYPDLGFCGDGFIEPQNGEQCDDGNVVSGDGCSSVCQAEVVVPPGGGGPGGGGGASVASSNIAVSPTILDVNLALDARVERTIKVTNLGTSILTVGVSQQGLDNLVVLRNTSLTLLSKQTVDLNIIFVSLDNQTGIFTGKIIIGGKVVLVSVDVSTRLLLFDSNIVVLNPKLEVAQGGQLKTLVTLIPLGDPTRLDVTLNFVIKDYTNKVYLTKSETLLITNLTEVRRNFDTGLLLPGDYVVGLQLIYPNGVAPSSAHFRVIGKSVMSLFGRIVLFLIIMILIVTILIIIIVVWRRRKKNKQENNSNFKTSQ
jgi:cysteine-rich repeat protein